MGYASLLGRTFFVTFGKDFLGFCKIFTAGINISLNIQILTFILQRQFRYWSGDRLLQGQKFCLIACLIDLLTFANSLIRSIRDIIKYFDGLEEVNLNKIYLSQVFSMTDQCHTHIIKLLDPRLFWIYIFFDHKFCLPKIYLNSILFWTQHYFYSQNYFHTKSFLDPLFYHDINNKKKLNSMVLLCVWTCMVCTFLYGLVCP